MSNRILPLIWIIWICSQVTKIEMGPMVVGLVDVLQDHFPSESQSLGIPESCQCFRDVGCGSGSTARIDEGADSRRGYRPIRF